MSPTTTTTAYYQDYLRLEELLNLQNRKSEAEGIPAHDEMLFIVIHQAYELWFKQILFELESVRDFFTGEAVNDHSPDMGIALSRLGRVSEILQLVIQQMNVMETMTALDFLDFRNLIVPASGFQSYQFRHIEALLGLRMEDRYAKQYYLQQFRPEHIAALQAREEQASLRSLIHSWLARFPFFAPAYWVGYQGLANGHDFWQDYAFLYAKGLSVQEGQSNRLADFQATFMENEVPEQQAINRAVLFIMSFRDYPLLQQPFKLIDTLIEIDHLLSTWRYRHMTMVRRMIGMRTGTGGTTGRDYLAGAVAHHPIFESFSSMATFLIERRNLPQLPLVLTNKLSFIH